MRRASVSYVRQAAQPFLTTSGGGHVPNPRPLAAAAGRLACAQRALAPRKRGSSRRREAVAKAAGLHAHADVNAAQNILRAGLALRAAGAA